MKNIYLCGPIRDVSTAEANEWRAKAKQELDYWCPPIKTKRVTCSYENPIGVDSNGNLVMPECLDEVGVLKFKCLDPMRRQFNDEDQLGVNEIVLMDLKDVEEADILLVNYNVARGETTLCGTSMEVFYASHILGKFVVAFTDLPPDRWSCWMIKYCTRILPSLDEAIDYIKRHF